MSNKFTNLFPEGQAKLTIVQEAKADNASGENNDVIFDLLKDILIELKIANMHLSAMSDEKLSRDDITDLGE